MPQSAINEAFRSIVVSRRGSWPGVRTPRVPIERHGDAARSPPRAASTVRDSRLRWPRCTPSKNPIVTTEGRSGSGSASSPRTMSTEREVQRRLSRRGRPAGALSGRRPHRRRSAARRGRRPCTARRSRRARAASRARPRRPPRPRGRAAGGDRPRPRRGTDARPRAGRHHRRGTTHRGPAESDEVGAAGQGRAHVGGQHADVRPAGARDAERRVGRRESDEVERVDPDRTRLGLEVLAGAGRLVELAASPPSRRCRRRSLKRLAHERPHRRTDGVLFDVDGRPADHVAVGVEGRRFDAEPEGPLVRLREVAGNRSSRVARPTPISSSPVAIGSRVPA